jgi:hypothetical protein
MKCQIVVEYQKGNVEKVIQEGLEKPIDNDNNTILHMICEGLDSKTIEKINRLAPSELRKAINLQNKRGETAIHVAVRENANSSMGDELDKFIDKLVDAGAKLGIKDARGVSIDDVTQKTGATVNAALDKLGDFVKTDVKTSGQEDSFLKQLAMYVGLAGKSNGSISGGMFGGRKSSDTGKYDEYKNPWVNEYRTPLEMINGGNDDDDSYDDDEQDYRINVKGGSRARDPFFDGLSDISGGESDYDDDDDDDEYEGGARKHVGDGDEDADVNADANDMDGGCGNDSNWKITLSDTGLSSVMSDSQYGGDASDVPQLNFDDVSLAPIYEKLDAKIKEETDKLYASGLMGGSCQVWNEYETQYDKQSGGARRKADMSSDGEIVISDAVVTSSDKHNKAVVNKLLTSSKFKKLLNNYDDDYTIERPRNPETTAIYNGFLEKIMKYLKIEEGDAKDIRSAIKIDLERRKPELKGRINDELKMKEMEKIFATKKAFQKILDGIDLDEIKRFRDEMAAAAKKRMAEKPAGKKRVKKATGNKINSKVTVAKVSRPSHRMKSDSVWSEDGY